MTNVLSYRGPSIEVLHEQYAKHGRIDTAAPVQGRQELVVPAPVARVWQVLVDVPAWASTLEPGVSGIRLEHGVTVDGRFTRSNSGARMSARFAVVEKQRELSWTGTSLGARAVHRFELTPLGPDATRVLVEESMAASLPAAPLLAVAVTSARLSTLLSRSLTLLAAAAERPAPSPTVGG